MPVAQSNDLRIFILNVGQADTSVIVTPDGNVLIIDACKPDKLIDLLTELGLQQDEEISHLIITHPHRDHYSAAERLLNHYSVESVTLAPFWHSNDTPGYHAVVNRVYGKDIPVRFISGYERNYPDGDAYPLPSSELLLELLGPSNDTLEDIREAGELTPNHLSVMARLTWDDFVMVFGADAQMENWAQFDREGMLEQNCSVLKAAHHGSCRGTQYERLDRLSPEYVIVSSEPKIKHHLPDLVGSSIFYKHSEVEDTVVALTSLTGSILITVRSNGSYQLGNYEEQRAANVPLGQYTPLGDAPTDWRSMIEHHLA